MKQSTSIVITGASSGIGEALALEYAAPGVILTLTGRDKARLTRVAEHCAHKGATAHPVRVDVTDSAAMAELIATANAKRPLDLVIANAGISGGSGGDGENQAQARAIFEVNLTGVFNTIWPAIEAMKPHGCGQIAIISSIAGITPMPGAPAYSAAKVAVKAYGEALHGMLKNDGITVTTVCPGFVKSRITDKNDFPMPLFMDAPKAARIIRQGLARGGVSVIFPKRLAAVAWLIGLLPPSLRVWLLTRVPKKA